MSVAHRMPDRLQELLQQRALIKEHLAWLDAKIAEASGEGAPIGKDDPGLVLKSPAPSLPSPVPLAAFPSAVDQRSDDDAQKLLEKLAEEEREKEPPSKSGCWLLFASAVLMLALGAWALLSYFYS